MLVIRSARAAELARRVAEAKGVGVEELVEGLLEREWAAYEVSRRPPLAREAIERLAREFRERNGIEPGGDGRSVRKIRDELWDEP